MRFYFVILFISLGFISCSQEIKEKKTNHLEQFNALFLNQNFIGHKGSGDLPNFGYKDFISNSFQSINHAVKRTGGSEVDIQISADSTLWVYHDHEIKNCENELVNISLLSDKEIVEISDCNYKAQLINFNSLIDSLKPYSYTDKVLSLDLKVLQNNVAINQFKGAEKLAELIIEKSKVVEQLNGFKLVNEVPHGSYLALFEKKSKFKTYLLALDWDRIFKKEHNNYSADIKLFEDNSVEVDTSIHFQLWTVNTMEELRLAAKVKADYLQTDNIAMADFIHSLKKKTIIFDELVKRDEFGTTARREFVDIIHLSKDELNTDFVIELKLDSIPKFDEKLALVFSGKSEEDKGVYWKAIPLDKNKINYFKFVDSEKLDQLGCHKLKVYIWNPNKESFLLNGLKLLKWHY